MNMYKTIRIRATGQVTEMVPDIARAMISSGQAEEVKAKSECAAVEPRAEHAVASAQAGPRKKSR